MQYFESDRRRLVPRFSQHGSLSAQDLDRLTAYPDIRIEREDHTVGIVWRFVCDVVPETLPEEFTWAVERSGSPGGPFERIAEDLSVDTRFFRDDRVPQGRERTQNLYYRLLLEAEGQPAIVYGYDPEWNRISGDRQAYGVTWMGDGTRTEFGPPLIREIRQRIDSLMNYAGKYAYLYREAWTQPSCAQCTNALTGTQMANGFSCRTCLGTGFVGGYYHPMECVFVPVDQAANLIAAPVGRIDLEGEHRVVMPYWPPVQPRDRIRCLDGQMYSVGTVQYPDLYGVPGLQFAVLSNIERSDMLNKIPLPDGARRRSKGPRRQRARSMNIKSYAQSLSEGAMGRASYFVAPDYQEDDR